MADEGINPKTVLSSVIITPYPFAGIGLTDGILSKEVASAIFHPLTSMDDPVRLNISIHSFWLELPAEDNSLINIFGVGVGVGLEVGVGVREGVGVSVKVGVDDGGTDVGNSLAAV